MEVRLNYGISLCLIQMAIFIPGAVYGNECRLCKPGYYASRLCSETHDTVCKPCSIGTFSPKSNVFRQCSPCSICDIGEFVLKECSKSRNTVCMSCDSFKSKVSRTFVGDCLENIYGHTVSNNHNIYDIIHSNRHKRNYESSGTSGDNNNDGSGQITQDHNATDVEEGSGANDIHDGSVTFAVPLSEDGDQENESDGVKTERKKEGISLQNNNRSVDNHEGILSIPAVQLTTTASTIITTSHKTGLNTNSSRSEPVKGQDDWNKGKQIPQHTESPEKGTSIGVVVAVGLVVAVVCFVLGFIASKYWSGRRERTFNVEEAERQNGKNPVAFYKIEYRGDDEKNPRSSYNMIPAKVNGSAPEMRPASDIEMEDMPKLANSQQVQRETAPIAHTTLSLPAAERASADSALLSDSDMPDGITLTVLQKSRPESEIHFIDEDAGENESGTLLLSRPIQVGETIHETSPKSSKKSYSDTNNDVDIEDDQEINNETTLMLPQNSESHSS